MRENATKWYHQTMARLQIGIESSNKDLRMTPVDKPMPPEIEAHARALVAWIDSVDIQPSDGEADFAVSVEHNIRIFGIRIPIKFGGNMFFRIKEEDDEDGS